VIAAMLTWGLMLQEAASKSGWEKLDDEHRAAVLSALMGLIALGVLSIVILWLGGRVVRRWMDSDPGFQPSGGNPDDWAGKSLQHSTNDEATQTTDD